MNTNHSRSSACALPLTPDFDSEDLPLQVYREVADALRQAYQLNKEAERYHRRGAQAAALHQVRQAGRHVHHAQARLRLLAIEQAPGPAVSTLAQTPAVAHVQTPVWQA